MLGRAKRQPNFFIFPCVSYAGFFLLFILLLILLQINLFGATTHAIQTVPYKINFQGYLTDASGAAKPDGQYNMKFRLMSASSGGSNLWSTDRVRGASDYRVTVTNGTFTVQFGDTSQGDSALSPSLFNTQTNPTIYLEVELPTPATATCSTNGCASFTEGAMTPRSQIGSSAYAMNSDTVDGIDGSSLARVDATNTFTQSNTYNSGTTNTYNGAAVFNGTTTVANYQIIGFNIQGTGSYTLQNAGIGGYMFTDTTAVHIGVTASGSGGSSVVPNGDALQIASAAIGSAAVNVGVGFGENILSNGGFEYGCAGWNKDGTATATVSCDTASPHGGAQQLKIVKASAGQWANVYSRYVAAVPGETIYASAWEKTSVSTNDTGGIAIGFYSSSNVSLGTTNSTTTSPGTTYIQRTVSATAPAGTAYVIVYPFVTGTGSTFGTWYFDDLYAVRADHPESVLFKNDANSTTAFQVQNAAGTALLVGDTQNLMIKVGGGDVSPDASPALLVLDYKNTSGDPSGVNGAMYYNSSYGTFRCYESGRWRDCLGNSVWDTYSYTNDFMTPMTFSVDATNFDGALAYGRVIAGSAAPTAGTAGHPGVVRIDSGTSSTAANGFISGTSAILFGNSNVWNAMGSVRIPTASSGVNTFIARFGFMSNLGTGVTTNGCYFRYSHSGNGTNNGNWQGVCASGASEGTACDTGIAAADNLFHNLSMVVNTAATSVSFSIDGGTPCTVTTQIPSGGVGFGTNIWKSAGGTARQLDIDYMRVQSYGSMNR